MKLQDLTKNKKYPCVLDLKMGFKALCQKDDNKFQSTTSSSVGYRFCGMNVYQPLKKNVIFKDKYWGRSIQQDNLKSSFQSFFYDGEKIRIGLIKRFVKQLKELKDILQHYIGYKFHSSSLLLIYDGAYSADTFKTKEKENKILSSNKNIQLNKSFKTQSCNSPQPIIKQKNRILLLQNNKSQTNENNKYDSQQLNLNKNLSNIPPAFQHLLIEKLKNIRNNNSSENKPIQNQFNQNENISNQNVCNFNEHLYNNSSNQQQQSFFDKEQKNSNNNNNNISQKNMENNYIFKQKSQNNKNDLIFNLDWSQTIQIKPNHKLNSQNSDYSLDFKTEKNDENDSIDINKNDEYYEESFDTSSQTLNNSFMSQGSDSSIISQKIEKITIKGKRDKQQKSLIPSLSQESISFKQSKPRSILKLIDFANIEINEQVDQPDLELIKGIENLIDIFEDISKNEVNTSFQIKNDNLLQQNSNDNANQSDQQQNDDIPKQINDNVNNILDDLNLK